MKTIPPAARPRPRQPVATPPGSGLISNLSRTTDWKTNDHRVLKLADMEDAHLWSVLGYLRWHAPQILELSRQRPGTQIGRYLVSRPIWKAIAAELTRRGLIDAPGQAIRKLRSETSVDWEDQEDAQG